METRIGTTVAGYRLESLLGRGGMSVVYVAKHIGLERRVALKLLAAVLAQDAAFRERFVQESQRAALLEHPNIIPIYDAGDADGQLYIAMRLVEGPDLKALIARDGPLGVGRTLFILEQVASALDAAHDHNLVHRDVKSANILIEEPSDHVYLTDFGVVKHTTSQGLTKTGFFVGTADYAAPEQIEGQALDARTDVYALGCVLYECLTGKTPFERPVEVAIMHAHLIEPPPKISAARPELPKALDGVIARALAKAKEDRFDTCEELIAAARKAVLGQPRPSAAARIEDPVHPAAAAAAPTVAEPPPGAGVDPAATQLQVPTPTAGGAEPSAPTTEGGSATPVTSPAAPGEPAAPAAAATAGAPPPPTPPPHGPGRGKIPRWALVAVAAIVAAVVSGVVVFVATGSDDGAEASAPPAAVEPEPPAPAAEPPAEEPPAEEPPAEEPPAEQPPAEEPPAEEPPAEEPPPPAVTEPEALLPTLIPAVAFSDCQLDSPPVEGTVESAICIPTAESQVRVHPDAWEVAIYDSDDAMNAAYEELLSAAEEQGLVGFRNRGRCTGTRWGGEGVWEHGPNKPGGRRFCYFEGDDAVIVWSHQATGVDGTLQPDHVPLIGKASVAGSAHDRLFSWWRFWIHRIGKTVVQ